MAGEKMRMTSKGVLENRRAKINEVMKWKARLDKEMEKIRSENKENTEPYTDVFNKNEAKKSLESALQRNFMGGIGMETKVSYGYSNSDEYIHLILLRLLSQRAIFLEFKPEVLESLLILGEKTRASVSDIYLVNTILCGWNQNFSILEKSNKRVRKRFISILNPENIGRILSLVGREHKSMLARNNTLEEKRKDFEAIMIAGELVHKVIKEMEAFDVARFIVSVETNNMSHIFSLLCDINTQESMELHKEIKMTAERVYRGLSEHRDLFMK
ncbi:MAG: hypothetical protein WC501_00595 [Candidatus Micrarchaeia archaeon]